MKKKTSRSIVRIITIALLIINIVTIIIANAENRDGNKRESTNSSTAPANSIIPRPFIYKGGDGEFIFSSNDSIYLTAGDKTKNAELKKIAEGLQEKIMKTTGYNTPILLAEESSGKGIYLSLVEADLQLGVEGYNLVSSKDKVEISSNSGVGVFNGVQTLLQLFPNDITKSTVTNRVWNIPAATITDKPEYSYRGIMIDVARHFFTVEDIKRQIDLAAQYKINKVHLHLSDDQGWRLEIKKYPDLTKIGGSTEVGGGEGGYYTQKEFKDIVSFAADRYIEIIPEFDMPGHSNAALASYGFLNADGIKKPLYTGIDVGFSSLDTRNEDTYKFINNVYKEVAAISPSKYLHIGGDEADSTPKEDYDYFVGRVSEIAQKYGKSPIGWDPVDTSPEINSSTILQNWKDSNEAAQNKNMNMIISKASKTYLDMKYNKDTPYGLDWAGLIPVETAYSWDPTNFAPRELILGIEAPLWTETISTVEEMDYMIYPRLLGYAEIGWTPRASRLWAEYKTRLQVHGERMSNEGINYYRDPLIWSN